LVGEDRKVEILAKAEFANPGGSVKDRAALNMIKEGIREGKLTREKSHYGLFLRQYRDRLRDDRAPPSATRWSL